MLPMSSTEIEICQMAQTTDKHALAARRTLRVIALFEAFKGVLALLFTMGVIDLRHHNVRRLAEELIGLFHMRPDGHYSSLLLHYADVLPRTNLQTMIMLVVVYAMLRWAEAFGLWYDRTWAEWLAALSGTIYIPFELHHCVARPTLISGGLLVTNVVIVIFMARQLWLHRQQHRQCKSAVPAGV
jgi:uncharacterized membrane protein (DUF2068 family)